MGLGNKVGNTVGNVKSRMRRKRVSGFTLVELMVVIAMIAALCAVLIPTLFDYIERANETADISNMHNIINAVNREFMLNENNELFNCCWGVSKGHEDNKDFGYIYVDDDEVRVSNALLAQLLEEQGYIKKASAPDRKRGNVEPSYYYRRGSRLRCQASRKWCRYQISFRKDDTCGGIWWGVTCASKGTTSSDSKGTIRVDAYDPVTTEDVAKRVGVAAYDRPLGGQE